MCAIMFESDKPVEINRKENLRDHQLYWIGRRAQDIVLSSLALVILSPVMLITAIAIVMDDPSVGPIFSQVRVGRNGKFFDCFVNGRRVTSFAPCVTMQKLSWMI